MCSDIRFGQRRQFSLQNNRCWSFWKRLSSYDLHSSSFSVISLPLSWPPTRIICTRPSFFLMCLNLHLCLGHTYILYFLVSQCNHTKQVHIVIPEMLYPWANVRARGRACVCLCVCVCVLARAQIVLTNISAVLYGDRLTTSPYSLLLIPWIFVQSIFLKLGEMH